MGVSSHEALHSANHTDGTDDIQNATAGQKGLATATQITKLDGIAEGADVTADAAKYTVVSIDDTDSPYDASWGELVLCDTGNGVITVNVPTAVGNEGKEFNIKKVHTSNTVTVDGNGTETIDGQITQTLSALYDNITLASDGANVVII
jgi:hypothetical protein